MLVFSTLLGFSHAYCIPICAVLVPLNLLATLQTMVWAGLGKPSTQVWYALYAAAIWGILMVFHVLSWFIVGVVMLPTYILLSLAVVCCGFNLWAVCCPAHFQIGLAYLQRSRLLSQG